jgi:hypothetical protein
MQNNSTQTFRRRLTIVGLIAGPLITIFGSILVMGVPQDEDMRQSFTNMGEHGNTLLLSDLVVTAGFTITALALISATSLARARGGIVATIGAIMAGFGIAGFGLANGTGLAVIALAQEDDAETAFTFAKSITESGPLVPASGIGWLLEMLGLIGLALVYLGLWRARVVPVWPFVLVLVGSLANIAAPSPVTVLGSVLLACVAGTWTAIRISRLGTQAEVLADAPVASLAQ